MKCKILLTHKNLSLGIKYLIITKYESPAYQYLRQDFIHI